MKIESTKEKLLEVIQKVEKVTGKNLTLPILSCIAFEAVKGKVIVKATNLDMGIECILPAKIIEEGSVAIPGQVLLQFLLNLSQSEKVKLELVDTTVSVLTENTSTTIKTQSYEDFPIIPKIDDGKTIILNPKELVIGLKSVWYSSAVTSMKPELSSVYIYADKDDMLVFVATDSFRLAEKKVKTKKGKDFGSLLIPFKNIPEIIRILEGVSDDISVSINQNQISFSWDGVYVISRIINGTFPDYNQIIPKESSTEVVLLKQDLIQSLKLANVFSDTFHQITLRIVPGEKQFEIITKNNDVGENHNTLDAVLKGEDITISFNYKYIVDCFQSLATDSVSLQFHGLGRPLVVRGVSDSSFMYLVMPMNK